MVRTPEPRSRDRPITKQVLVVDDHPAVSLALRVAFRLDGRFAVADSAATGAEGLRKLAGQDAVLLDLHLPDMGGSDAVSAFRERGCGVPLILHSAVDDTPGVDAVRGMVDAVVLKSRVDDVLTALGRLTDQAA
jgi:two-component system response regulator FimZ (fimbrial Z protein)